MSQKESKQCMNDAAVEASAASSSRNEGRTTHHPSPPSPATTIITNLLPSDVLMGRGAHQSDYEGNKSLRQLVLERRDEYDRCHKHREKQRVSEAIVEEIKRRNIRFLKRAQDDCSAGDGDATAAATTAAVSLSDSKWVAVVDDQVILDKVKQLLRDMRPDTQEKRRIRKRKKTQPTEQEILEARQREYIPESALFWQQAPNNNTQSMSSDEQEFLAQATFHRVMDTRSTENAGVAAAAAVPEAPTAAATTQGAPDMDTAVAALLQLQKPDGNNGDSMRAPPRHGEPPVAPVPQLAQQSPPPSLVMAAASNPHLQQQQHLLQPPGLHQVLQQQLNEEILTRLLSEGAERERLLFGSTLVNLQRQEAERFVPNAAASAVSTTAALAAYGRPESLTPQQGLLLSLIRQTQEQLQQGGSASTRDSTSVHQASLPTGWQGH